MGYGALSYVSQTGIKNRAVARITSVQPDEVTVGDPGEPRNCVGDSEGPAFSISPGDTRRIISVVSRSGSGSDCTGGSIHTRVDAHLDWIESVLLDARADRTIVRRGAPQR